MQTAGPNHRHRNRRWSMIRHCALLVSCKYQFAFKSKCMLPPPPAGPPPKSKNIQKTFSPPLMRAGLSAVRLYLQGIRACGPDAAQARRAAQQGRDGRNLRRLNGVMRRLGGDSGNLAGGEICDRGLALRRFSGEMPARKQTVRPTGGRFYRLACRVIVPVCRHSRSAGMAYLNHWIPACACLQQAGWNDDGGGNRIVAIPTAPLLFLPNS